MKKLFTIIVLTVFMAGMATAQSATEEVPVSDTEQTVEQGTKQEATAEEKKKKGCCASKSKPEAHCGSAKKEKKSCCSGKAEAKKEEEE